MFSKTNAFLADLAGGRAEGNWQTRLRRSLTPNLVILDDFASAPRGAMIPRGLRDPPLTAAAVGRS